MTTFTIIGTGTMGTAIGDVLTSGGNTVTHIAHSEVGTAPVTGDVVVLAVHYPVHESIVATYADQLAGKVVVDITNPLDFDTFDSLVVPAGSSATAELQDKLPNSSVLKAFNTTFAATLSSKSVGANTTTVLIAGDDNDAKEALSTALTASGLQAVDAGALSRAHELEALGFLQLTLAASEKVGWNAGFALVP